MHYEKFSPAANIKIYREIHSSPRVKQKLNYGTMHISWQNMQSVGFIGKAYTEDAAKSSLAASFFFRLYIVLNSICIYIVIVDTIYSELRIPTIIVCTTFKFSSTWYLPAIYIKITKLRLNKYQQAPDSDGEVQFLKQFFFLHAFFTVHLVWIEYPPFHSRNKLREEPPRPRTHHK